MKKLFLLAAIFIISTISAMESDEKTEGPAPYNRMNQVRITADNAFIITSTPGGTVTVRNMQTGNTTAILRPAIQNNYAQTNNNNNKEKDKSK